MVVDVKLEDAELRILSTAPNVYVVAERAKVSSLNGPVGDIDLSTLKRREHGAEV